MKPLGTAHRNRRFFMKILIDDIPYDLQNMAEIVGIDNFLEICKMYGGNSVYIPVYKKVIMASRNRDIVQGYNGRNINDLRFKYNMSYQQIKNILKEKDKF